jgi:predicted dehydrogenase
MLRVGIIGAGRLARTHVRHLQRVTDAWFSVFDVVPNAATKMAEEIGGQVAESVEALLDASDAVLIVTPNHVHADFAVAAINAGKHVFVEKPLTVSTATATPILEASQKATGVVLVGHVLRHFPMYRQAHDSVIAGAVGTPSAIRMTRGGRMPGGEGSWFADHSKSGGAFIDLGVHDFDWLLWTLGKPTQVYAKSVGAKTGNGPDYGLATVSFANGAVAHVESTWMDENEPYVAFEVCGSGGMIEYDSRRVNTLKMGAFSAQNFLPNDDPFYRQMRNFVNAIRGEETVAVTVQEAYDALHLGESALTSAKTGQPVWF